MALSDAYAAAVVQWPLNEASGTRADFIGANDLTDDNTVGSASGVFGTAADFERDNNERLSLSSNATVQTGDINFTLRVLVKLESKSGAQTVVSKWGTSSGSDREYWLFYWDSPDRFRFTVQDPSGNETSVDANNLGSPSTGTTYLIHCWHDATNNQIGIAVNGGTANTASHTGGVDTGTAPFRVGANGEENGSGGNHHFDGLIEDVVFLKSYVMDATERTADYNSGSFLAFENWAGGGRTTKNTRSHPLGMRLGINWRVGG